MHSIYVCLVAALCGSAVCVEASVAIAQAKSAEKFEFVSKTSITEWIDGYRHKPEPWRLPAAVRFLSQSGALREPESAGFYLGFAAGVLGANPREAESLVGKMLPLPAADQWFVVRALAYSRLPAWKSLLARTASKLDARRAMSDKYLADQLPTMDAIVLDKTPTFFEKLGEPWGAKPKPAEISFATNPDLLDALWGQYFANGQSRPISRILTLLPWSQDRDSLDRLTVGSAAKYTLANNAARYPDLLKLIREMAPNQSAEVKPVLAEVIRAAETAQTANIKKQQLAEIEKLKTKGSGRQRDMKLWGYATEGAIGVGCIVAASLSLGTLGLPCVIGGAATTAVVNYWAAQ